MDNASICVQLPTNKSGVYSDDEEEMQSLLAPKIVIMTSLGVFIAVANGVLLWTILSHRYLRKRSYMFVMALASADFLFGFVSIPLHVMGEAGLIAR